MSLTYTFILAVKRLLIIKGPDRKLNKNPIQVVFLRIYHQTPKIFFFFFCTDGKKTNNNNNNKKNNIKRSRQQEKSVCMFVHESLE